MGRRNQRRRKDTKPEANGAAPVEEKKPEEQQKKEVVQKKEEKKKYHVKADPKLQQNLLKKFGGQNITRKVGGRIMRVPKGGVQKGGTGKAEKRLHAQLRKLQVSTIPGIEELNLFTTDGNVVHFKNPKKANVQANMYVFTGDSETKNVTELMPGILRQMDPKSEEFKKLALVNEEEPEAEGESDGDSDIPELVGDFS